jgi:hypothetical protein
LRLAVGEDEQCMTAPPPLRKSAYEEPMFALKGDGYGRRP